MPFLFLPELNIRKIEPRFRYHAIDGAVSLYMKKEECPRLTLPMLFIEIDKQPLIENLDQKNVGRMAVSMAAALKKLLGVCRGESIEILRSLFAVGILAGGTQFDFCIAFPDFGSATESDFGPEKPFPLFHIFFQYSKKYLRFNLFGENDNDNHFSDSASDNNFYKILSNSRPQSGGKDNDVVVIDEIVEQVFEIEIDDINRELEAESEVDSKDFYELGSHFVTILTPNIMILTLMILAIQISKRNKLSDDKILLSRISKLKII